MAGTRCKRTLGTRKRGRRSMNSKNGALIRGGGDIVQAGGEQNVTPISCRCGEPKIGGPRTDYELGGP